MSELKKELKAIAAQARMAQRRQTVESAKHLLETFKETFEDRARTAAQRGRGSVIFPEHESLSWGEAESLVNLLRRDVCFREFRYEIHGDETTGTGGYYVTIKW